jgi:hypothetical protein
MKTVESYERNINQLIEDSLIFLFMCAEENDHDLVQLFARTSAIYSMLILEASANLCIDCLDLERSIYKDVDKLSVLAKFDFYLRASGKNRVLDRGNAYAQRIQEIKTLRDGFVHPKMTKVSWKVIEEENNHRETKAELTKMMKIAKHSRYWEFEDLLIITRSVHEFLRHFFIELCGMSASESCGTLFSERKVPSPDDMGPTIILLDNRHTLESWGIPVDYLCGEYEGT